ncbi:MAG: beta-N-acetylhexosaminidase [Gemmatimonadota bacterium]|nr:beta-N-acetylhexosaminidase [Gemmatimonadota bacterium]
MPAAPPGVSSVTPAQRDRSAAFSAPLSAPQRHWVDSTLASLTLRQRVAQMVWIWVLGDYTNSADSTYADDLQLVADERIGGLTMSFGSPIEVAAKVNSLQRAATVPLLVSSDLEPDLGRLVGGSFLPSLMSAGSATILPTNMAIGATGRPEEAFEVGRIVGQEARGVGIQVAFAPVVDVNNNPANPVINTRSFGESPGDVARLSAEFIRGVQSQGVAATAKHFPGHGDTDTDSHLALPIVKSSRTRLDSVELVPFRAAIAAGVAAVMSAHIALPAMGEPTTPATLVPQVITGLLRDTLGFGGVIFTDALTMEAVGKGYSVEQSAVLAIQAGADVLLKPTSATAAIDAVVAAVGRGDITASRIDQSVRRLLELKVRTGVVAARYADLDSLRATVGAPAHWQVARRIAAEAVTCLRNPSAGKDGIPLLPGVRAHIISYAPDAELVAGRAFEAELRALRPDVTVTHISPRTGKEALQAIAALFRPADAVVVTTHVRTIEGVGRFAIAPQVAAWIEELASLRPVIVIASGNPYVIRQFPHVSSYLVTYGIDPSLEQAAARILVGAGHARASGVAPISLPGFFSRGDGGACTTPAS